MFSAATRFSPPLPSQGHHGIALTVYLQDGALFEACFRKWYGVHNHWFDPEYGFADADERWLAQQHDLVFGIQCKTHVGHNSVVWAFKGLMEADTSDETYIVLNCLCKSSGMFHSRVDVFLRRFVAFVERTDPVESRRTFWACLDLKGPLLELFTECDPLWDEQTQRLCVATRLESDPHCWDKLQVLILSCRRWTTWSETRWARFGRAGRLFTRSACTGLHAAHQQLVEDPLCMNSNLAGYRHHVTDQIRKLLAVAALAAIPGEAFVRKLLKDDRLALRASHIMDVVLGKLRWVCELPTLVWARLAAPIQLSTEQFMHDVILCSCISFGYIFRYAFLDLQRQPWNMTQGDIAANVEALAAGTTVIRDERVERMYNLLQSGVPSAALVDGLELLREAPFSTKMAEEAHASGALMMNAHERYSEKALRTRALLHQLRSVTKPDAVAREERGLERRFDESQRDQPNRARGSQIFLHCRVAERMAEAGHSKSDRLQ